VRLVYAPIRPTGTSPKCCYSRVILKTSQKWIYAKSHYQSFESPSVKFCISGTLHCFIFVHGNGMVCLKCVSMNSIYTLTTEQVTGYVYTCAWSNDVHSRGLCHFWVISDKTERRSVYVLCLQLTVTEFWRFFNFRKHFPVRLSIR